MRSVDAFSDQIPVDGTRESRPAAAGVELVGREEKGRAVGDVDIDAFAEFIVVFVDERSLRGAVLSHLPLQRS